MDIRDRGFRDWGLLPWSSTVFRIFLCQKFTPCSLLNTLEKKIEVLRCRRSNQEKLVETCSTSQFYLSSFLIHFPLPKSGTLQFAPFAISPTHFLLLIPSKHKNKKQICSTRNVPVPPHSICEVPYTYFGKAFLLPYFTGGFRQCLLGMHFL